MPVILVVDDSPTERLLVGRLLEKEKQPDWVIEYANNGREALAYLDLMLPDLIVTDLLMPELDGLQLVAEVRRAYPTVPVVLMTSQGNETVAVQALQQGAASFVAKRDLAAKLLDTVYEILAVARAEHRYDKLARFFVETRLALELENDPALIAPTVDLLQQTLTNLKYCETTERIHLGVALEEALLNGFYYGALGLSAEQAEQARSELSHGREAKVVQDRRAIAPYQHRKVFVEIGISRDDITLIVRDQGNGFTAAQSGSRRDATALEGGGRGLMLMRTFADEVSFNAAGNEVKLIKRRPHVGPAASRPR
jgi:CheY-like chemotaxis protein